MLCMAYAIIVDSSALTLRTTVYAAIECACFIGLLNSVEDTQALEK